MHVRSALREATLWDRQCALPVVIDVTNKALDVGMCCFKGNSSQVLVSVCYTETEAPLPRCSYCDFYPSYFSSCN